MIRHGILIIQTENQAHTAQRIYELALSIRDEKAEKIYRYPIEAKAEAADAVQAGEQPAEAKEIVENGEELLVPEAALAKDPESDDLAVARMWAKMKGVTLVMGKVITKKFSVAELARGAVTAEEIKSLKTANGRELNKKALASLKGIRSGSITECAKLLGGAKSVGPNIAKSLMEAAGSFSRFCSYGEAEMAIITIQQKNRSIKLGKAKAERIFRLVNFKAADNGEAPPPKAPPKAKPKTNRVLPKTECQSQGAGGARRIRLSPTPPGGAALRLSGECDALCADESRVASLTQSEVEDFLDSLRD
jgi:hypothetical protein